MDTPIFLYFLRKVGAKLLARSEEVTASRALTKNDLGKQLLCNSDDPIVLTVPIDLPFVFETKVVQMGAGQVSFVVADIGHQALMHNNNWDPITRGQGSAMTLTRLNQDLSVPQIFLVEGDLMVD